MSAASARSRGRTAATPQLPKGEPARPVSIGLDGKQYCVIMTRTEERQFRMAMRPYVARARLIQAPSTTGEIERGRRLSSRLRQARVQALLGIAEDRYDGPEASALEVLVERAAEIYAQSLTQQTRATYKRRWARFTEWCAERGVSALPAEAGTVMAFLADELDRGKQPALSTLRGMVNAINRVHREYDLRPPSDDPALGMLMRGLSRSVAPPARSEPMSALRIEELRAVCRAMDHPNPVVMRDAALLRLTLEGLAPGMLARLRWQDVRFDREGALLGLRAAKNGPVVAYRQVSSRPDPSRCPVVALQRWRAIAGSTPPLVFTGVDNDGHREPRPLRPSGVSAVITSRLDSLRPGATGPEALTTAADLLHEVTSDVLRDRALLLLGFAMAARRGELTNLTWGDLREVDEGLIVLIRRSKTDLDGRGTEVGVPWGHSLLTCPVRAVLAWRERTQHQLGASFGNATPVFVRVGRAGRISPEQPLTGEGVTMVVKRRVEAAGIAGRWGGRSLRAGLISSAADLDIALEVIAQQSRHASLDSLVRYVRNQDVFLRNAVDRIGM